MTEQSIFAGIDVSKKRLDLALRPSGTVRTLAYDPGWDWRPGIGVAIPWTLGSGSGVHRRLGAALGRRPGGGLPAGGGGHPRQVRDFAKATGRLAKTDVLDAQVLAHFAEAVRLLFGPCRTPDPGTPFPERTPCSGGGNAGGGEEPAGPG